MYLNPSHGYNHIAKDRLFDCVYIPDSAHVQQLL